MRIRGIKFICDRCGKSEFCKLNNDGEFEEEVKFHTLSYHDGTHLCDNCEQEREALMAEFMKGWAMDD